MFCNGIGTKTPDIVNASRPIKDSERNRCKEKGVTNIIEVKFGFDGIAFINSKKSERMNISLRQLYLALAREIPDGHGNFVPNYHQTWDSIDPSLPNTKIEVLGPPPTSGTRDAFVEIALESGCKTFESIKQIENEDKQRFKAICRSIREDGVYQEVGEQDNLIVRRIDSNPDVFGIVGFSFLDQNVDFIQGSLINNVAPDFDLIASGDYPISRSLYFYIKGEHIGRIPGIEEYLSLFIKEGTIGEDGSLTDMGLIPLPQEERQNLLKQLQKLDLLQ